MSVYRNLKNYKFTNKLTDDKRQEIISKIDSSLDSELIKLDMLNLDPNMSEYINLHRLYTGNSNTMFLSKDNVAIDLFAGEHMTITASSVGYDKSIIDKVRHLDEIIRNKIELSYNDTYGYLMSDLTKIGTGIKLECDIDLISLSTLNKIDQLRQNVRNLGYSLKKVDGSVYTLSTICNLGFSETEIIDEFDKMVQKLQDLECESAKMLASSANDELLDKVMRSMAILKSAHLLETEELSEHLTNLRLGANLGFLNLKDSKINALQELIMKKNSQFASKSEHLELAKQVKNILKGE